MSLSFRLQKHSKALMFLNCASPEPQMTRQRFLKWTQPAKSRLRPRLAAPQDQALTSLSRKLSDIGLQPTSVCTRRPGPPVHIHADIGTRNECHLSRRRPSHSEKAASAGRCLRQSACPPMLVDSDTHRDVLRSKVASD